MDVLSIKCGACIFVILIFTWKDFDIVDNCKVMKINYVSGYSAA